VSCPRPSGSRGGQGGGDDDDDDDDQDMFEQPPESQPNEHGEPSDDDDDDDEDEDEDGSLESVSDLAFNAVALVAFQRGRGIQGPLVSHQKLPVTVQTPLGEASQWYEQDEGVIIRALIDQNKEGGHVFTDPDQYELRVTVNNHMRCEDLRFFVRDFSCLWRNVTYSFLAKLYEHNPPYLGNRMVTNTVHFLMAIKPIPTDSADDSDSDSDDRESESRRGGGGGGGQRQSAKKKQKAKKNKKEEREKEKAERNNVPFLNDKTRLLNKAVCIYGPQATGFVDVGTGKLHKHPNTLLINSCGLWVDDILDRNVPDSTEADLITVSNKLTAGATVAVAMPAIVRLANTLPQGGGGASLKNIPALLNPPSTPCGAPVVNGANLLTKSLMRLKMAGGHAAIHATHALRNFGDLDKFGLADEAADLKASATDDSWQPHFDEQVLCVISSLFGATPERVRDE
jgi:hypothetical protein